MNGWCAGVDEFGQLLIRSLKIGLCHLIISIIMPKMACINLLWSMKGNNGIVMQGLSPASIHSESSIGSIA